MQLKGRRRLPKCDYDDNKPSLYKSSVSNLTDTVMTVYFMHYKHMFFLFIIILCSLEAMGSFQQARRSHSLTRSHTHYPNISILMPSATCTWVTKTVHTPLVFSMFFLSNLSDFSGPLHFVDLDLTENDSRGLLMTDFRIAGK